MRVFWKRGMCLLDCFGDVEGGSEVLGKDMSKDIEIRESFFYVFRV